MCARLGSEIFVEALPKLCMQLARYPHVRTIIIAAAYIYHVALLVAPNNSIWWSSPSADPIDPSGFAAGFAFTGNWHLERENEV